jgi:branched-chain amino acid transport system permease protein
MRIKLAVELLGLLVLAALIAVMPRLVGDFTAYEFAIVGMYFIALLGLAILTGYSGQISLGHGAFMAIGGYTTAILSVDGVYGHQIRDLWTIPLAGLVAGVAGLLVGIPALRLSGLYLALITFGIAVSFPQLPKKFDHFFGGTTGKVLNLVTPPFGLDTTANDWLYYLTWGIAFVLLVFAWLLLRGKPGRALQAIRDSEIAAASSGVNLATYKTLAFGISAFYAGVAGALVAISTAYVNPQTFPITLSLFLVVGLAVGGLGSLVGSVAGAILIQFLPTYAQDVSKQAPQVIEGAILIAVMLLLPGGVGGLARLLGGLKAR